MTIRLRSLSISALSLFLATSSIAAPLSTTPSATKLKLNGKRLADQLLSASDEGRKSISPKALAMAIRRHGLRRAALRADFIKNHTNTYSLELDGTPIDDQAQSGRCWIFTTLTVLEHAVKAKTGKTVKLSRNWVDAKNLQASAYELLQSGANVSNLRSIADNDMSEGGYFGWATQLVDKYGVVPEHVMRDFADSKGSAVAMKMLQTIVVEAQDKLRATHKDSPEMAAIVKQAQVDIDRAVARAFTGKETLVEKFKVDGIEYTPKTYAESLDVRSTQYVSLKDQKAQRIGWYMEGRGVHKYEAYNTGNIELMKEAVINSLKEGRAVYVAYPVGSEGAPFMSNAEAYADLPAAKGIISIAAHDYETLGMGSAITDRATVQRTGLYNANHAMTIVGVDIDKKTGKVIKWKFKNSWGKDAADKGIQHVYDDAFTSYVEDVSVPVGAVPKSLLKDVVEDRKARQEINWELAK